jgi:hypothetical protein
MHEPALRRAISELLNRLGTSPAQVAFHLNTNRIQGVRNAARFLNPIVRYIQVSIRCEALDIDVIQPDVLRVSFPKGQHIEVPLPTPVNRFIRAFNEGAYPEMEVDGSDCDFAP